jgi:probable F420-dependent oxidoreductase
MHSQWGLTIPLAGMPLPEHASLVARAATAGYTDLWSSEVNGADAFTPLALASQWAPTMRLGTAIAPVYTRGPALLAMTAATLAEAAPGRVAVGIGASSPAIVADWNGLAFDRPFARTRDTLRFLRRALAGEVVDEAYPTFTVRRFRLERPPAVPPRLMVAALRPGMLRLAAAEADGVILNWLAETDLPQVLGVLADGPRPAAFEVVTRIFVCPSADVAYARQVGRRLISSYLTVEAYAEFHRWLGRSDALGPMWEAWAAGDRKTASASVPDEVVDALVLHGPPGEVRERIAAYAAGGVDTPVLLLLPVPGLDPAAAVSALGPTSEATSWT